MNIEDIKTYIWQPGSLPRHVPINSTEAVDFYKNGNRVIAQEKIRGYFVSTVFLTTNHSFGGEPPILFETMVFNGEGAGGDAKFCRRYETEEDARSFHGMIAQIVRDGSEDWCQ